LGDEEQRLVLDAIAELYDSGELVLDPGELLRERALLGRQGAQDGALVGLQPGVLALASLYSLQRSFWTQAPRPTSG
jgi:hypothetical protein